ncbi:protein translocase subunit SecD [Acidovorax sp.]|uniref:protein translocase subunit SecD n=1 Tax=Acidovorax sp. TaxID=1872122 RepID=UPI00403810FB
MNRYPVWKYAILVIVLLVGALYTLPNFFGEAPAVQVSSAKATIKVDTAVQQRVEEALKAAGVTPDFVALEGNSVRARFDTPDTQLKAKDAIQKALVPDANDPSYIVALNLVSRSPLWLKALHANPMYLGLDLRGGVHFMLQVDMQAALTKKAESYAGDIRTALRDKNIRHGGISRDGQSIDIKVRDEATATAARNLIADQFADLQVTTTPEGTEFKLRASIKPEATRRVQEQALKQNMVTLHNRINELGVAEPVIQQQGLDRIVVQLPGVQDTTRVKDLLGATATLEYRAVSEEGDALAAASSGIVPAGAELFYYRGDRRPYLLKREIIASGNELVDAAATVDENGQPAVSVTLDGVGGKRMLAFTEKNLGKPMAVVFRETEYSTTYNAQGEPIREQRQIEEIISVATIRGVFSKRFQTTGLESKEAQNLAVLLRAGALAAPVEIIEERTVGPSLGADNIRQGFAAAALGLGLVVIFMAVYYRVFGLFAIAALLMNLLIVVAVLSLMQATLTMPGIAGIVLHMGIAVDANVLIYERIREELRNGNTPHAAIQAGYDRAFRTIADANISVLIATVVLFALGAGAVKGFAITLTIGIISSQFTAIVGSRALAQLIFAKKRMTDVPVW